MDGVWSRAKYIPRDEKGLEKSLIDEKVNRQRDNEAHDESFPDRVLAKYQYDNQEKKSDEHSWNITHSCKKSIQKCPINRLNRENNRIFESIESRE
jgi:hypothetical protein